MSTIERPGYTLAPVVETWEATVYQVTGVRTAYLVVPRTSARGFEDALSSGQIDETATDYLATPDTGRALDQHALMLTLGLFDRLGDAQVLAAPERDPLTGLSGHARNREDKNQDQPNQSTGPTRTVASAGRALRWPILIGAAITAIVLAGIGLAVANSSRSVGDGAVATAVAVATNTAATSPSVTATTPTAEQAIISGTLYKDPVSKVACMRFADGREAGIGLPDVESVRLEVEQDWQNAKKLTFVEPSSSSRLDIAYGETLTAPGQVTPNPFPDPSCGPFTAEILGMPR